MGPKQLSSVPTARLCRVHGTRHRCIHTCSPRHAGNEHRQHGAEVPSRRAPTQRTLYQVRTEYALGRSTRNLQLQLFERQ